MNTANLHRAVGDAVARNREWSVELLSRLISFPTVTPGENGSPADHGRAFRECTAWLRSILQDRGFETDIWTVEPEKLEPGPGVFILKDRDMSGMPVLTAVRKGSGGGRSLILNGHYDVVPPGNIARWDTDPFVLECRNDMFFGRGVADMKGGIAAILTAIAALDEAGISPSGDLIVEIVPDEEFSSMGTLACCRRGIRADAGIVPESTNWKTYVATRGNITGTITVPGRAAHADYPQPPWTQGGGVNSIEKAALVISSLAELNRGWQTSPEKVHPLLPPDSITPTLIRGGEWEIMYPDSTEIFFTCNFIPGSHRITEEIQEAVTEAVSGDSWLRAHPPAIRFDDLFYASEISPGEPIVELVANAARSLGLDGAPGGDPSLTDSAHLVNAAGVPSVAIGPADRSIHQPNESMSVEDYRNLVKFLALSIAEWTA